MAIEMFRCHEANGCERAAATRQLEPFGRLIMIVQLEPSLLVNTSISVPSFDRPTAAGSSWYCLESCFKRSGRDSHTEESAPAVGGTPDTTTFTAALAAVMRCHPRMRCEVRVTRLGHRVPSEQKKSMIATRLNGIKPEIVSRALRRCISFPELCYCCCRPSWLEPCSSHFRMGTSLPSRPGHSYPEPPG